METGESLPSMNPNRGPPVLDWSEDPSVGRARTREKHRTAAFTALFLAAGSIVVILSLSDGVGPADALYLPSAGLVWLFGLSALSSLVGFDRTNAMSGKLSIRARQHGMAKVRRNNLSLQRSMQGDGQVAGSAA